MTGRHLGVGGAQCSENLGKVKVKVKCTVVQAIGGAEVQLYCTGTEALYRPGVAQRMGRGIAILYRH